MKKIGIIIPTYNEGENIENLVEKIKSLLPNSEIFIIDDSKTRLPDKIFKNKNLINYFHRGQKLGRGTAVIFGLEHALKKDYIDIFIEMDADFSHDPNELNEKRIFFEKNKLDMLIASRYTKKSTNS